MLIMLAIVIKFIRKIVLNKNWKFEPFVEKYGVLNNLTESVKLITLVIKSITV